MLTTIECWWFCIPSSVCNSAPGKLIHSFRMHSIVLSPNTVLLYASGIQSRLQVGQPSCCSTARPCVHNVCCRASLLAFAAYTSLVIAFPGCGNLARCPTSSRVQLSDSDMSDSWTSSHADQSQASQLSFSLSISSWPISGSPHTYTYKDIQCCAPQFFCLGVKHSWTVSWWRHAGARCRPLHFSEAYRKPTKSVLPWPQEA
jgi:hypothetical protein